MFQVLSVSVKWERLTQPSPTQRSAAIKKKFMGLITLRCNTCRHLWMAAGSLLEYDYEPGHWSITESGDYSVTCPLCGASGVIPNGAVESFLGRH